MCFHSVLCERCTVDSELIDSACERSVAVELVCDPEGVTGGDDIAPAGGLSYERALQIEAGGSAIVGGDDM